MLYFGHVVRCKIDRISLPAPRRALRDTKYSTIQCRKSIWYVHSGRRPSALSEIEAFISHLRSSLARLCITHRVTEGALIQERQSAGLEKKTRPRFQLAHCNATRLVLRTTELRLHAGALKNNDYYVDAYPVMSYITVHLFDRSIPTC